jgi:hypothetical protein
MAVRFAFGVRWMKMNARVVLCMSVVAVSALCLAAVLADRSERARAQAAEAQSSQPAVSAGPDLKPAPSTPLAEKKADLGDDKTWRPEWDAVIEKALPNDLLSQKVTRDVKAFCPRFPAMSEADKRAYWAYFFQALSGAEAGLKATSDVQHIEPEVAVKDSVSHRMVRSEGLLQLTYEDANRYGCDFDWDNDKQLKEHDPDKTILQPENNLLCGVKILERQIIEQKKPLLSKTSYWSTLRPGWPGFRVFLQQMANVPEACGRKRVSKLASKTNGTVTVAASH